MLMASTLTLHAMRIASFAFVSLALAVSASAHSQEPARPTAGAPRLSFAEPGISPNGDEIAFVHAGDIWVVPARGGEARLLVAHPANESRPIYSPDGARLAFMSNRAGGLGMDLWVMTLATGQLQRRTRE